MKFIESVVFATFLCFATCEGSKWEDTDWAVYWTQVAKFHFIQPGESGCDPDSAARLIVRHEAFVWTGIYHLHEFAPLAAYQNFLTHSYICMGPSKHCNCLYQGDSGAGIRIKSLSASLPRSMVHADSQRLIIRIDPMQARRYLPKEAGDIFWAQSASDSFLTSIGKTHSYGKEFDDFVLWLESPPKLAKIESDDFQSPYWTVKLLVVGAQQAILENRRSFDANDTSFARFAKRYLLKGADPAFKDSLRRHLK
jgi:hypothetical protein